MKLLGFEDILDRAIEKYEVETPSDMDEWQKYRDTAIKKLRKIAKKYPSPGEDSYFSRATSNGKKTSPRYFTRSAADQIIMLAEDYFSKNSSNPRIRGLSQYRSIKEKAAAKKEELSKNPTTKELEQEYEERVQLASAAIRSAYDFDRGDQPFDQDDFDKFVEQHGQSIANDILSGNEYPEPDYSEFDDPVPASRDDIEKFIKDRRYGAIRKGYYSEEHRPPIITGIYERQMPDPSPRAREMKEHLLFEALFDYFFTPIDLEALKEDLFITEDPEEVHHDATYYLCQERLQDYSNYTQSKVLPIAGMKKQLADISSQLNARISKLEKAVSQLPIQSENKPTTTEAIIPTGDIDLSKKVESLEKKVSALALTCFDLNNSIKSLIEKLDENISDEQ